MDKKILMPLALVLVLSLGVFVIAGDLNWGFSTTQTQTEEKLVNLIEGWNLIQGFADPSFIVGSTLGREQPMQNIKAIFVFHPLTKKYVRVYPNPDRAEVDSLPPVVLQLPFWVYSSKGGYSISYETQKLESTLQITWPSGWSLISISNEMVGKSLNELSGNCVIEKAYGWGDKEKDSGSWILIPSDMKFDRDFVGYGLAIKLTSECTLGTNGDSGSITPPPQIPN